MNGDSDVAVRLAERLLAHPHPLGGYSTVELLPGRVPDDLPIDLMMPADGRVLGSAVERRDGELSAVQVIVDIDRARGDATQAYIRQLKTAGWTEPDFGGRSGFISSAGGPPHMLRKGDQGPMLMIQSVSRAGDEVELRLRLDFSTPRNMPSSRHGRPEAMDLIPALHAPEGVAMEGGGGGGSGTSWWSQATAKTTMPVGDLESFFSDQLVHDRWTRLSGDSSNITAWSSWKVGGRDDWRAILIVLAAPNDDQRWLTIHMQRRSQRGGGWASAVSRLVRH